MMDEREPYRLSQAEIVEFCNEVGFAWSQETPASKPSIPLLYLHLLQRNFRENDRKLRFLKLPSLEGGNIEELRELGAVLGVDLEELNYHEAVEYALVEHTKAIDEARVRKLLKEESPASNMTKLNEGKGVSLYDLAFAIFEDDELAKTHVKAWQGQSIWQSLKPTRIGKDPNDGRASLYKLSELSEFLKKLNSHKKQEIKVIQGKLEKKLRNPAS